MAYYLYFPNVFSLRYHCLIWMCSIQTSVQYNIELGSVLSCLKSTLHHGNSVGDSGSITVFQSLKKIVSLGKNWRREHYVWSLVLLKERQSIKLKIEPESFFESILKISHLFPLEIWEIIMRWAIKKLSVTKVVVLEGYINILFGFEKNKMNSLVHLLFAEVKIMYYRQSSHSTIFDWGFFHMFSITFKSDR